MITTLGTRTVRTGCSLLQVAPGDYRMSPKLGQRWHLAAMSLKYSLNRLVTGRCLAGLLVVCICFCCSSVDAQHASPYSIYLIEIDTYRDSYTIGPAQIESLATNITGFDNGSVSCNGGYYYNFNESQNSTVVNIGNFQESIYVTTTITVPTTCTTGGAADANSKAEWYDTLTPMSVALPAGSQVVVRVTFAMDNITMFAPFLSCVAGDTNWAFVTGALSVGSGFQFTYYTGIPESIFPTNGYVYVPGGSFTIETNLTENVGQPFAIDDWAAPDSAVQIKSTCNESGFGQASVSHAVYVDCLTPGVNITSASGHLFPRLLQRT